MFNIFNAYCANNVRSSQTMLFLCSYSPGGSSFILKLAVTSIISVSVDVATLTTGILTKINDLTFNS